MREGQLAVPSRVSLPRHGGGGLPKSIRHVLVPRPAFRIPAADMLIIGLRCSGSHVSSTVAAAGAGTIAGADAGAGAAGVGASAGAGADSAKKAKEAVKGMSFIGLKQVPEPQNLRPAYLFPP